MRECWGSEAAVGASDQPVSKASGWISPRQWEAASAGAALAKKVL